VNVPIDLGVDGSFVRTVYVGYRVQQFARMAVASHDIVAGTVLDAGDVTMGRVPSFGRLGNGTDVLIGRKIISAVRKGQPVYIEATATNQIVKPGSSVVLIVNDGGVSVVVQAVARTGGGLGDEVNVYNPSTNKALSGTVVGPDRVELDILGVSKP
jgi:flagella basal body P-ring formation protein FlgA